MMQSAATLLVIAVMSNVLVCVAGVDFFRSTHRLELLIKTERDVLEVLNTYIKTETFGDVECERKTNLVNFYDRMRMANSVSRGLNWIHNPINSLRLLKRFVYEWEGLFNTFEITVNQSMPLTKINKIIRTWKISGDWPKPTDLRGVVEGIVRLVIVYDLDLVDFANGIIKHTVTNSIPTTEMQQLGDSLYTAKQFYASALVFNATVTVARNRASLIGRTEEGVNMWLLYEQLHESYFDFGSTSLAIGSVNDAMTLFPSRLRELSKTLSHYKSTLLNKPDVPFTYLLPINLPLYGAECYKFKFACYFPTYLVHIEDELKYDPHDPELLRLHAELLDITETHRLDTEVTEGLQEPKLIENYKSLCQGEMKSVSRMSTLYCEYQATVVPFFRGKKEYVNIDPDIVIFHHLLEDSDIEWFKNTALNDMYVSEIYENNEGKVNDEVRVSETAWMWDETKDEITRRLTRKIELLTGLVIDTEKDEHASEVYQVLNYGVGGMYTMHLDAIRIDNDFVRAQAGHRIATIGIYLSDVELGGATVFPLLKTRIQPEKGSAAFWWNTKRNGDIDVRMMHAGCPVLYGSKWFVNKLVLANSQMFSHPCSLDPNL